MLCGVTATLGSNPSATATAARPRWGRAALLCLSGSPAMSHVIPLPVFQGLKCDRWNCNVCGLSRKMTELNYVRNMDGGFLGDACRRRSQALRTVGCAPIGGFFRLKYRSGSLTTSHAIPLWLVQTLNLHRWNCNVCGLSRKMTELNFLRLLEGWLPPLLSDSFIGRGR